MSSIAKLLKEFSAESSQEEIHTENIEEGQVGAEEMTVVTDETTTELEEAIEEVAEAVEGQEQVAETTETLLDAAESLENAVAQIEELRLSGQRVNAVSMKIWARGVADSLEARQIPAEVYQDLMDDFGASFESTDTYSDYSVEAEEKGEGIMAKIWNMIKSAFARARDFLARLIAWFGKSADSVEKAGKKLLAVVKEKQGKKVDKDAKINAKAYSELMEGTSFNPVASVDKAEGSFSSVSGYCDNLYGVALDAAKALSTSGDKKSVILKAGKDTTKKLEECAKSINGMAVAGMKEFEMKVESNSERFWNEGKVKYTIKTKESTKTIPGDVAVMSLADLKSLGDSIVSLARTVRSVSDEAKRTQGKINITFGENKSGEQKNMAENRIVARTITSTVAASSAIRGKVASSVLSIGKKAYVFGMANVRRYK